MNEFIIEDGIEIPSIEYFDKYSVINGMKKCNVCNEIKNIEKFNKDKSRINGYQYRCKQCNNKIGKNYYNKNKEKVSVKQKEWRDNNPLYMKDYNENNIEKIKKYRKDNKKKLNLYCRKYNQTEKGKEIGRKSSKKIRSTPKGKITSAIRGGIGSSLKGNKNGRHWEDLVGYTLQELMNHLESKFEDWMTWGNYGRPKNGERKWSIDHVKPISSFSFDSYNDEEFKKCWALNNIRPLCFVENSIKFNKII